MQVGPERNYSFFLPRALSNTLTGSLTAHRNITLSGITSTGITFSSVSASGSILLSDSGETASFRLPLEHLQIQTSGYWDGSLWAPTLIGVNQNITVSGPLQSVLSVYTLGGSGVSLSLIGNLATVTLPIDGSLNGKSITVLRSESQTAGYSAITSCTIQNGMCQFQTNHFSYFALSSASGSVPVIDTIAPVIILSGSALMRISL